MLELKGISKRYNTGGFEQTAMDHISVAFRDNEFVAILGPSGSGKTTMLNVIGGLDRFDSGDLLVDGISTKKFKERDWDTYRNNRIGFVFQAYNLIPHQSVVSNVELALTLSGVSKSERHERALEALDKVGLKAHANKRPNQLSGGQMQRVAIARALVNDPEILLADEPTGALDSSTSVQVMDLLKEVAKDRLVIMVTHNPELAHQYATRIVELADGQHNVWDIFRVSKKAQENPNHLIIGARSFSGNVPLRSAFGNKLTRFLFKQQTGVSVTDTFQTLCMLLALILIIYKVIDTLGMSLPEAVQAIVNDSHSRIFVLFFLSNKCFSF